MEHQLEWLSDEEGCISLFENYTEVFFAKVFLTGEKEAEFKIQDVVGRENLSENGRLSEKIILKMTKYLSECFRLLWEEGFEEIVLVEQKGTKTAEIIDSTSVVQKAYSEYMMLYRQEPQKSTDCGQTLLRVIKAEDGYFCENEEKTFFCRLLPYESRQPGEQCFYLYDVEVKKNMRNAGIATACLKQLLSQLSKEQPVTVYLQVGSYNRPAVHLYQKLGFTVSEELCYYRATF